MMIIVTTTNNTNITIISQMSPQSLTIQCTWIYDHAHLSLESALLCLARGFSCPSEAAATVSERDSVGPGMLTLSVLRDTLHVPI